jgi:hypothetical protein
MWFIQLFIYVLYAIILVLGWFLVVGVVPYAFSLLKEEYEIFKKRVVYEVPHGHHRLGMPNANSIAQELVRLKRTGQLAIARAEWVL